MSKKLIAVIYILSFGIAGVYSFFYGEKRNTIDSVEVENSSSLVAQIEIQAPTVMSFDSLILEDLIYDELIEFTLEEIEKEWDSMITAERMFCIKRLTRNSPQVAIDFLLVNESGGRRTQGVLSVLSEWVNVEPEAATGWLEQHGSVLGLGSKEVSKRVWSEWMNVDQRGMLNSITREEGKLNETLKIGVSVLLDSMVSPNGDLRELEAVSLFQSDSIREFATDYTMNRIVKNDPLAASNWLLENNENGYTEKYLPDAISSLAFQDPYSSIQLAESLKDPELKDRSIEKSAISLSRLDEGLAMGYIGLLSNDKSKDHAIEAIVADLLAVGEYKRAHEMAKNSSDQKLRQRIEQNF